MKTNKAILLTQKLKNLSPVFSIIILLVVVMVIAVWIRNIAVLNAIIPQWVGITAICFLFAGFTLSFLNYEKSGRSQTFLVPAFSCLIILIAGIFLSYQGTSFLCSS